MESELGFRNFVFISLKYEQKLGVEVFVGPIYYVMLYPYLLSFHPFNNVIFRFLLVLFTFVVNKLNQESTVKEAKDD